MFLYTQYVIMQYVKIRTYTILLYSLFPITRALSQIHYNYMRMGTTI